MVTAARLCQPVETGGIYQVGPHTLACGDLQRGHALELIRRFGPPDTCYVDPPWTPSMATQYLHKARIAGRANFRSLLQRLVEFMAQTKRDVFCEIGVSEIDVLRSVIERNCGRIHDVWNTTYYHRSRAKLIHCSWGEHEQVDGIEGLDDERTPFACLSQVIRPGDAIADPCLGLGLTGVAVTKAGGRLLGMELNPKRLQKAIERLSNGNDVELRGKLNGQCQE